MDIVFENHQEDFPISEESVCSLIRELLSFKNVQTDEISLRFVTEEEISSLHQKYFRDSSVTDCITFPIDSIDQERGSFHCLGEIVVCPKMALKQSVLYQTDPHDELFLYIVHGFLHLLGFDDQTEEDSKIIREEEAKCMERITLAKIFSNG